MKMSEKKRAALYGAIRDPITDLRIKIKMKERFTEDAINIDLELYKLEGEIHKRVEVLLALSTNGERR